jgi:hypothetical protein
MRLIKRYGFIIAVGLALASSATAQDSLTRQKMIEMPMRTPPAVAASPAYAELLLHKTEIDSTLESLLVDYNEGYPKVKELRTELTLLNAEIMRLMVVKPADAGKLTLALGRLMLRKVELETELSALRVQYKDDHPDVRKLKRKIDVFESAIREILE